MTYNILEGGTGRIDPLAEVIRLADADVVVVAEASDEGQFHRLADRLGMDRFWADHAGNPEGSVGLLSRWEIREAVNGAPVDRRLTRSALHAIVRKPRVQDSADGPRDVALVGAYLHAGELLQDEAIRQEELGAVLDMGKLFHGREHILAGDFNAAHPQQIIDLQKARAKTREKAASQGGEIPRSVVRSILQQGYVDAHALHHAPADFGCSLSTSHPAMRVDYIFVTPGLSPLVRSCEVFQPEIGRFASDHYPVVADIGV